MNRFNRLFVVWVVGLFCCQPLLAQQPEKKALARAQFMLKQVNAEKAGLQQQLQQLQKEFDDYKKDAENKLSKAKNRERRVNTSLGKWKESHGNIKDLLRQNLLELSQERKRAEQLVENLVKQTENFTVCHRNNTDLAIVNNELLAYYNDKSSFLSLLKQREPVTGIASVKAENIIQDYKYRIEDLDLNASAHLIDPVADIVERTDSDSGAKGSGDDQSEKNDTQSTSENAIDQQQATQSQPDESDYNSNE